MGSGMTDEALETFTSRDLRDALGCFATGVTVVTISPKGGQAVGLTVNSFSSVSLEPPLVLWSVDRGSENFEAYETVDHFAVNVLDETQEALSTRFATRGALDLEEGEYKTWVTGAPILPQTLAQFDCRVKERFSGGDHVILLGEVVKIASRPGRPLLFASGAYRQLDDQG